MFGKITSHHIRRSFNNTKRFFGHTAINAPKYANKLYNAYKTTRGVLSTIDDGVETAKNVYQNVFYENDQFTFTNLRL